jgi:hypothetical protein
MGGLDYVSVHMAIKRLEQKMAWDERLPRQFAAIKDAI